MTTSATSSIIPSGNINTSLIKVIDNPLNSICFREWFEKLNSKVDSYIEFKDSKPAHHGGIQ